MAKVIRIFTACLLAATLVGCSNFGGGLSNPFGNTQSAVDAQMREALQLRISNKAAANFVMLAERDRLNKNYVEAHDNYQSALQLVPNNAVLLTYIADMKWRLNDYVLAEQIALQSNRNTNDRRLLYLNWSLIRQARRDQDDLIGAEVAKQELLKYAG